MSTILENGLRSIIEHRHFLFEIPNQTGMSQWAYISDTRGCNNFWREHWGRTSTVSMAPERLGLRHPRRRQKHHGEVGVRHFSCDGMGLQIRWGCDHKIVGPTVSSLAPVQRLTLQGHSSWVITEGFCPLIRASPEKILHIWAFCVPSP